MIILLTISSKIALRLNIPLMCDVDVNSLDSLLSVIKTFAIEYLSIGEGAHSTFSPQGCLGENLRYQSIGDQYLDDMHWFEYFPSSITVSEIVRLYEFLREFPPST